MIRRGYRYAVKWIAENDSPGADLALDTDYVQDMFTVNLVADLFGRTAEEVALKVVRYRRASARRLDHELRAEDRVDR